MQALEGELPTDEVPTEITDGTFTINFQVEKDTLRPAAIDITADLGAQGNVTINVDFSNWDEPVSIEAPAADQVQS
jgi:hypothetical protein